MVVLKKKNNTVVVTSEVRNFTTQPISHVSIVFFYLFIIRFLIKVSTTTTTEEGIS